MAGSGRAPQIMPNTGAGTCTATATRIYLCLSGRTQVFPAGLVSTLQAQCLARQYDGDPLSRQCCRAELSRRQLVRSRCLDQRSADRQDAYRNLLCNPDTLPRKLSGETSARNCAESWTHGPGRWVTAGSLGLRATQTALKSTRARPLGWLPEPGGCRWEGAFEVLGAGGRCCACIDACQWADMAVNYA